MREYALYKGDELLGIGTVKELSEKFKIKPKTLLYYQTPTYARRTDETKARRLIKLEDEKNE